MKRLADRGLVDHKPYHGVELTAAGRQAAIAAIRRHRIVERFLADMLGYAWNEADRLATSFEHELPQEVEDRLFVALDRPGDVPARLPDPGQGDGRAARDAAALRARAGRHRGGRGARLHRSRDRRVPRHARTPARRTRRGEGEAPLRRTAGACGSTARTAPSVRRLPTRCSSRNPCRDVPEHEARTMTMTHTTGRRRRLSGVRPPRR